MTQRRSGQLVRGLMIGCGVAVIIASANFSSHRVEASPEPTRIVGPEACGECHEKEVAAWESTSHFTGFKELHRRDEAKAIGDKLGIRRIRTAEECASCHYTPGMVREKPRAVAGVSCESCHGAARDWIKIHDRFGGGSEEAETAAQRADRRKQCEDVGMCWPENISSLATNCLACHVIADQKLIEIGGHPTGAEFELVAWSQGEVRHNFYRSDGKQNLESSVERRRKMFVLGQVIDLKASVAALGAGTGEGPYLDGIRKRIARCRERIAAVAAKAPSKDLEAALAATKGLDEEKWSASLSAKVKGAAEKVAASLKSYDATTTGQSLAGIDSLLPGSATYVGKPLVR